MKAKPERGHVIERDVTPENEATFRAAIQAIAKAKPIHRPTKRKLPGSTILGKAK